MHTYIHVHIHTQYTHTYMHIRIQILPHIYKSIHINTDTTLVTVGGASKSQGASHGSSSSTGKEITDYMIYKGGMQRTNPVGIHSNRHTHIHTYIHTYIPAYLHTYTRTYTHINTRILHAYILTYIHSFIRTHIQDVALSVIKSKWKEMSHTERVSYVGKVIATNSGAGVKKAVKGYSFVCFLM